MNQIAEPLLCIVLSVNQRTKIGGGVAGNEATSYHAVNSCVVITDTWLLPPPTTYPPQVYSFPSPQVKAEEVCVQLTNEYEERLASVSPSQFTL